MKFLVDIDPDLNRRLIAKRLGWPDDALAECLAVEAAARQRAIRDNRRTPPEWLVYWGRGRLDQPPQPGYRALMWVHDERGHRRVELFAEDPGGLTEQMEDVERSLPVWPAHLTPLTPPR